MREMKNSGVEWIGAIPTTWHTKKMKYISNFIQNKYSSDYGLLPYIGLENIASWSGSFISTNSQYDREQSLICEPEDILFGKLRPYLAKVYMNDRLCCCSNEFAVIRVNGQNKRYMWYQLLSHGFIFEIDRSTYGTKMPRANAEFIRNVFVALPSEIEQQKIANYLDKMCAEIDAVLEKTRASIEEYKKLKQAVITQAVTKGIRGDRPMKNSGIEWVGEIANEFAVYKFKYLLKTPMQYGANEAGITFDKTLPRYIRITDITSDGRLKQDNRLCIEDTVAKPYILQDGDLLFARSGGTVGKSFLYKQSYGNAAFAGYLIRAVVNRAIAIPEYVYYYTNSSIYDTWKNSIFIQSTIQNIGADRYSNMPIIVPNNIEEQRSIVEYLNERCDGIDALIRKKQQYLTEIENYKKSLIYEYVTGKKEVV